MRVDRNRVICLTNDHKELMARIERLMHELHAVARCGLLMGKQLHVGGSRGLTNERKELMPRIERLMHELHAVARWVLLLPRHTY